jgi:hypothetical protein
MMSLFLKVVLVLARHLVAEEELVQQLAVLADLLVAVDLLQVQVVEELVPQVGLCLIIKIVVVEEALVDTRNSLFQILEAHIHLSSELVVLKAALELVELLAAWVEMELLLLRSIISNETRFFRSN